MTSLTKLIWILRVIAGIVFVTIASSTNESNIALRKPAHMSSGGNASYGCDGNNISSAKTDVEDTPWWLVNLEKSYFIDKIYFHVDVFSFDGTESIQIAIKMGNNLDKVKEFESHWMSSVKGSGNDWTKVQETINSMKKFPQHFVAIVLEEGQMKVWELQVFGEEVGINAALNKEAYMSCNSTTVSKADYGCDGNFQKSALILYSDQTNAFWLVDLNSKFLIKSAYIRAQTITLDYDYIEMKMGNQLDLVNNLQAYVIVWSSNRSHLKFSLQYSFWLQVQEFISLQHNAYYRFVGLAIPKKTSVRFNLNTFEVFEVQLFGEQDPYSITEIPMVFQNALIFNSDAKEMLEKTKILVLIFIAASFL